MAGEASAGAQSRRGGSRTSEKEPEMMCPPENFGVIHTQLYRSSVPRLNNLPFLRSLRLTTVLLVCEERTARALQTLLRDSKIAVTRIGPQAAVPQAAAWKPLGDEAVKRSLELMLAADAQPLLLCDVGGVHAVGMIVGCLRKIQMWNVTSIINEYRLYAAHKRRYVNEQFIELFDTDLVNIPHNNLVPWFSAAM
ncbi:unnamed protein product [Agarophyton chilense]